MEKQIIDLHSIMNRAYQIKENSRKFLTFNGKKYPLNEFRKTWQQSLLQAWSEHRQACNNDNDNDNDYENLDFSML